MQICSTCGKPESEVSFYYRNGKARSDCISCYLKKDFNRRAKGRTPEEMALANPCRIRNESFISDGKLVRKCAHCGIIKDEEEYRRSAEKGRKCTLNGICKDCKKKQQAASLASSPEKILANRERAKRYKGYNTAEYKSKVLLDRLKRDYGLDYESYNALVEKQNGKCAICCREAKFSIHGKLYVDHCHTSGVVRGLLCHKCNSGLGMFEDNTDNMLKAIAYLKGVQ